MKIAIKVKEEFYKKLYKHYTEKNGANFSFTCFNKYYVLDGNKVVSYDLDEDELPDDCKIITIEEWLSLVNSSETNNINMNQFSIF